MIKQISTAFLASHRLKKLVRFLPPSLTQCARQIIALRGQRCNIGSVSADVIGPYVNDGNFRALLRYRNTGVVSGDWWHRAAGTASNSTTHQSADIQNELIKIAGDLMREPILLKVKKVIWTILADETTDWYLWEQVAFVLWYLLSDDNGDGTVLRTDSSERMYQQPSTFTALSIIWISVSALCAFTTVKGN